MNTSNLSPMDVGVVYKKTTEIYTVLFNRQWIQCRLSPALYAKSAFNARSAFNAKPAFNVKPAAKTKHPIDSSSETVTVGDEVRLRDHLDGTGQIVEVLPRRSQLSRRGAKAKPGSAAQQQIIAANVEQVVAVFAVTQPDLKWNMLDRYLVTAEASRLPVLICISKFDLVPGLSPAEQENYRAGVEEYQRLGYAVIQTSAETGEGMPDLRQALNGRVSVLLGKSGVGKTSLLNALQPGLGRRVHEVSQTLGKGQHTTTNLEMVALESGGALIDTPGVREFGLWDVPAADLAWFFPEMRPWLGQCRFRLDCQHNEEPGCAIRKAVMAGSISPRRYFNYLKLAEEIQHDF